MRKSKWFATVAIAAALMMVSGGMAMADTLVVNDLATGGDTTLEPGDTGSAKVWLEVSNGTPIGDPNGCNATGSTPAIVTLSASPNIVSFSSTATLTGCGVLAGATVAYTVSNSATSGQIATISGTITGGKNGSLFNTDDNFKVTVDVVNTAPSVAVTGFVDGASYEKGVDTLPTPGCLATDAEDDPITQPSPNADTSGLNAFGLGTVTVTCDYTDGGGLAATQASASYSIVDTTAPTNVAFTGGGITNGASYYFGSVPAGPTGCTATDVGSGLASCQVTGGGTSVGPKTFTAMATDNVGLQSTATLNYTVLAWTVNGFYSPVDLNNVVNVAKAGSTVPLKFEIFSGTTELTDTTAIDAFTVARSTACNGSYGGEDAIEQYSTGGTSLRYDTTGGQFVQNWKVPAGSGICYRVTMLADDGSSTSALFKSK